MLRGATGCQCSSFVEELCIRHPTTCAYRSAGAICAATCASWSEDEDKSSEQACGQDIASLFACRG